MLSQKELKKYLYYSPSTGDFVWVKGRGSARIGSIAGFIEKEHGYRIIRIFKRNYRASRLAWFYMTGEWPKDQVDHWNRKRADNRWKNLRPATESQNHANQTLHCDSWVGLKGVTRRGHYNKWRSRIVVRGKEIHLGMFNSPKKAHRAYATAARHYFGEYAHV